MIKKKNGLSDYIRKITYKVYTFFVRKRFKNLETYISPLVEIKNPDCISIFRGTSIRPYTWLYAMKSHGSTQKFNPSIEIGENCSIGRFCHITCSNNVKIENDVFITERVLITDSIHGYNDIENPILTQPLVSKGPIVIGSGTWIGNGSAIVGKVTIGKNCVVAANSVVSNMKVSDYSMVMGSPAKVIKRYDTSSKKWEKIDKGIKY
tara:strand:+ start:783 stop:1403 length:621 start_codon:yes stop_codon:yes gene_type:complete